MDDPVSEIAQVITTLCTAPPSLQQQAVEKYFTPTASFTHPICRTGSFNGSRWLILKIYRWYKILSPRIEVGVNSIAFDEANMLLYVSLRQIFKIQVIPFYRAEVYLTTVLALTNDPYPHYHEISNDSGANEDNKSIIGGQNSKKKYYIQSQNDLYQTSEWIKFVLPWGIGVTLVMAWQFWATIMCIIGAICGWPITWLEENVFGGNLERVRDKKGLGKD